MTVGEKIRFHRKALGLTQTELGERLGVKTNAVSKWECGRVEMIPTSKIKAMAALFDVLPSYLIDDGQEAKEAISLDIGNTYTITGNFGCGKSRTLSRMMGERSEIQIIFDQLSPANQTKLLELAALYLDDQRRKEENP